MARVSSATAPRNLPAAGTARTAHGRPGNGGDDDGGQAPEGAGLRMVPPGWVPLTTTVLCVLAVADAAYLTYAHYTSASVLACPTNGFVNCGLVTTSVYSHPLGIPVADAGLIWAIGMLVICSPWGWRQASPWFGRLRILGVVGGLLSVFYLLWAELVKLHHLCEYCTVMHVLTLLLFLAIVFGTALAVPADDGSGGEPAGA